MKTFVLDIATHLHKTRGYDVTLICDRDDEFAASLPEFLRYIPVRMSRGVDFGALGSIRELVKIFKREKFDLVQYSTPNASLYASVAAHRAKIPVRLYAQWGIRYMCLSGISRRIFKAVEKHICRLSTHVRSQSLKNMQFILDERVCKQDKIGVIGIGGTTGVELSLCDSIDKRAVRSEIRERLGIPSDAFLYGFVGRLNKDKGVGELLCAFLSLSEKHKNTYLLLVGGADGSIDEKLFSLARENSRIRFAGSVAPREVYSYMAAMDVLVHPTYREGFGKVIQEAMGMSLPVVTTDIPGPSEVIENGVSGILARVGDKDDLAVKMELLLTDGELLSSLAKEGRARAEKYFDRPIMLGNIAEEMEKILGE